LCISYTPEQILIGQLSLLLECKAEAVSSLERMLRRGGASRIEWAGDGYKSIGRNVVSALLAPSLQA
jgi:hypothetical protein